MKIYHTMFWTLVLLCINVHANTISKTDALQKAKSFLSAKDNKASVETYSILGKAEMYKVVTDEGWCLLSSEKSVKPVLAYSTIDNFPSDEEMPEGMKWLFSLYEEIIAYAKEHAEEDGGRNIWETDDNQYNSPLSNRTETVYLSRLGTVKWGQSANNNSGSANCQKIYNKFCPDFHSVYCNRTIVGCGAVALGQVLWYYQWPYYGLIPLTMLNDQGLVSSEQEYRFYDWELMPDQILNSTSITEVDTLAAFLRDCGYAEHMQYKDSSSTTYVSDIKNALNNNFGYTTAIYLSRNAQPSNWVERMKDEIRNGRPVIYRGGNNSGGHFFVLHGFSGDYFNINWGWRGSYNGVMCTLDSIYYSQNHHYNLGQYAIINIVPSYSPSCSSLIVPSTDIWSTNFMIQNGGAITIGNRTITSGMHGTIFSGESVTLTNGFKIEEGAEVYIEVKDMHCDDERDNAPSLDNNIRNTHHALQKQRVFSFTRKVLIDGQIYILRGEKVYTLTGAELK